MAVTNLLATLLLLFATAAPRARSVEAVVEVRVIGNQRVTTEQVLDGLRTRAGRQLDPKEVEADIRDLYSRLGVRATVTQEQSGLGLLVTFAIEEEALIRRVEVRGVAPGRAQELLDEVSLSGVRGILESQVRERADELARRLENEGRHFAEVDVSVEVREGEHVAVLDVREGPKVEVSDIEFVGLTELDPDHLKQVMTTQATRLLVFKNYLREDQLERDIIEVERYLHSEGFRDAKVSREELRFDAAQGEVVVVLRVQEGERYLVSAIDVEGNVALATEEILGSIELAVGAPLRTPILEKDRRKILLRYGDLGYIRAAVEAEDVYAESGPSVKVVYRVSEGDAKRVRDVVIRGNASTRDEVIRREISLHPGDVANADEVRKSAERLRARGFFVDDQGRNLVDVKFKQTGDPLLEDLFVDVEEARTGRFYFTAGGMTDIGLFAGINFEKNNFDIGDLPSAWDPVTLFKEVWSNEAFHGGGQQLEIHLIPGTSVSDYRISFTEPYFAGSDRAPWSLNVQAYGTTSQLQDEFREDRYGASTAFTKRIDEHWSAGVSGRFDLVDIGEVDDAPDDVDDVEGLNLAPAIGGLVRYAKLDRLLDPKEGFDVGAKYELLGFDAAGQRVVFDGSWFQPLHEDDRGRKQVLALRGALGAAQGFSGELPFFERFRGGGASGDFPIRGFEYRGVGPEDDGVHLGGHLGYAASAEYRFPVYSTYDALMDEEIERLRGVAFVDLGSIDDTFGQTFGTPRLAVGAGVRVLLPFLGQTPVALDVAVPLLQGPEDETELLSIRVSTRF